MVVRAYCEQNCYMYAPEILFFSLSRYTSFAAGGCRHSLQMMIQWMGIMCYFYKINFLSNRIEH